VLYLVFDPDRGSVEFANAGHLAPLVRDAGGRAHCLSVAQSPPLGAMGYARFDQQRAKVDAGSTLLLFTDGLVEQRGAGLVSRLEELREVVERGPDDPAALCDAVTAGMQGAEEREDDLALLALRLEPLPEEGFGLDFPAEPEVLATIRTVVERWLQQTPAEASDIYVIKAATMEACANAIEHAYRPGDAAFRVETSRSDGEVCVTVRDFGRWREQRGTDRGRGFLLMEGLMDSAEVTRSPQGSTVRLRRRLGKALTP
jgi:anti-sigma regulatory factor (Ser/Thr protein kinase)